MDERQWCDESAITAIARLDKIGPRSISRLLAGQPPLAALEAVLEGRSVDRVPVEQVAAWRSVLASIRPGAIRAELATTGLSVAWAGSAHHPSFLLDDVDPAPVLYRHGRAFESGGPSVAVVGTRRASGLGREIARELGLGLAEAGVCVVSGLALGVDGAAHEGALFADGAPPVAFVGGGADVVYPRRHADLWARMRVGGTVASEAPPGARPAAWRFPARNRLIAACADIVVVVESRETGGSMLTVNEAIRRNRQVMAVPGSLRNPAAAGPNTLLADGCAPVLSVDDVLTALGISQMAQAERRGASPLALQHGSPSSSVGATACAVLTACDDGPSSTDELVARTGLSVQVVLAAVSELLVAGHLVDDGARVRRR